MFTAKKLDFVQVNTATDPITVKSTDVVEGYTFGNQSVNTSAYVNANGKLTNGGTLIVTDEMIVTGSGAAGTVTVKGLDENSVAYIVGGTDMPKGDRFYTDIKVLNVYTDEAVIRTGNYNVTFTDTAYVGNGYYEIDGKPYYYLNGRSYGTNVYFLYATGSGYTAGGSGFISAFVPYETSAPYYGYKKASTTPRIGVYNYNVDIAIGSSSATVGAGNVGMLLTGANYNNGYAKLVNAVNGRQNRYGKRRLCRNDCRRSYGLLQRHRQNDYKRRYCSEPPARRKPVEQHSKRSERNLRSYLCDRQRR